MHDTCEYCDQEKEVIDISDDPIHVIKNSKYIDINIICKNCLINFVDRLKRFLYA